MAAALIRAFTPSYGEDHPIEQIVLKPSHKGRYEISADGTLVYSKKQTGKHIADDKVVAMIRPLFH